ncbi:MAG: tyrosine-type recombinase/integrase [Nannocystis sp.]|nr:tyrosine-type recombinase/integrase [Nannocystis sp.]
MPSPRVVPAALALVAEVSPLLQVRSARQWTLWLGQLQEPGSAIVAALREQTPTTQISLAPPSSARPLRAAALRADRDRLAAELLSATRELARLRDHAAGEATRAADVRGHGVLGGHWLGSACAVHHSLGETWRIVRALAGFVDVRLHDLRHSMASDAINNGVPLQVVGKMLGHKNYRKRSMKPS